MRYTDDEDPKEKITHMAIDAQDAESGIHYWDISILTNEDRRNPGQNFNLAVVTGMDADDKRFFKMFDLPSTRTTPYGIRPEHITEMSKDGRLMPLPEQVYDQQKFQEALLDWVDISNLRNIKLVEGNPALLGKSAILATLMSAEKSLSRQDAAATLPPITYEVFCERLENFSHHSPEEVASAAKSGGAISAASSAAKRDGNNGYIQGPSFKA